MPHSEQLDDATLARLAEQLPRFLLGLSELPAGGTFELCESFKLYELPAEALLNPATLETGLAEVLVWKRSWHVQLDWKPGREHKAQAVGHVLVRKGLQVAGVFASRLSELVDQVIVRLNELPDSAIARLVVVPSHYMHMLWVAEGGNHRWLVMNSQLKRREPYEGSDLLARLRSIPHSIGVGTPLG